MRTIYLASDSRARRKLLKFFGMKFHVVPGRIREISGSRVSPGNAAVANALAKAQAVAAKLKKGVVIGADTVVEVKGVVYGKPASMSGAAAMLKAISGKKQRVYTGLAVIDVESGREETACECTTIYMDKLSPRDIAWYCTQVNPLDLAGSFDIQGKGAFFIRRIEGCFYNVVGLPLRRLYRIFRAMGILGLVLCAPSFFLGGCATEYSVVTGQEEQFFYSTEQEVKLGQSVSREIEKKFKLAEDPLIQKRVEDIGEKIVAVCDRRDIRYHFKALRDKEVNAVSLPGGYVYVNEGLIEKVDNDDELAAVLAHEVGHIVARHSIKKLQAMMGYSALRILMIPLPQAGEVAGASDLAFSELIMGYSREDELLADRLAARYAKRAGYDPQAMITFLRKLHEVNRRKPIRQKTYYQTHPYVPDRVRVVKQELGQGMDFADYINIEQNEHE